MGIALGPAVTEGPALVEADGVAVLQPAAKRSAALRSAALRSAAGDRITRPSYSRGRRGAQAHQGLPSLLSRSVVRLCTCAAVLHKQG